MPICRECDDEVDELVKLKVDRKTLKLCDNRISRVENLVSLPALKNLSLKGN